MTRFVLRTAVDRLTEKFVALVAGNGSTEQLATAQNGTCRASDQRRTCE